MMKMKTLAAVAAAFAVSAPAFADAKSKLDEVLSASGITVSGRAEAGYDVANTNGNASPEFAAFNKGDSFVFHQAGLNIAKTTASGVGGAVTLLAGTDAETLTGSDVYLLQGYVSYSQGALTVIGGRFLTLSGAEVVDASANFNSSRSLLWFLQPLVHTGVRATYKVSDALSLTGGLVNTGFGSGISSAVDSTEQKALELNAVFTTGSLTNSLTAYVGDEDPSKNVGRSLIVDYVGTLAVSPELTLALNADYYDVDQGASTQNGFGVAGYANYKFDAKDRIALRAEYLDGQDVFAVPKRVSTYTITLGHAVTSDFEVIAEARLDDATKGSGLFATNKGDSEYLGSLRAVYKF